MVTYLTIVVAIAIIATIVGVVGYFSHQAGHTKGSVESEQRVGHLTAEKEATQMQIDMLCKDNVKGQLHILELEAQLKKTLSQKKSSEVRTGLIAEQMAPFLEGFPYAPGKAIFLGKPLDFLVFDEDGVHFVEVKSGKAQLNSNQRKIRDQLKEKKVTFEVYRIKGE